MLLTHPSSNVEWEVVYDLDLRRPVWIGNILES